MICIVCSRNWIFVWFVIWANLGIAAPLGFEDVSQSSGVNAVMRTFGISWGDVNSDGRPDVWVGVHGGAESSRLYVNQGDGTFVDEIWRIDAVKADMHGAAWADFDNDGDQDMVLLVGADTGAGSGPNQFFVNNGGILSERAAAWNLDNPLSRGRTPLWFDADNDGLLDLLSANSRRPDGRASSSIFLRRGDSFIDSFAFTGFDSRETNQFAQLLARGEDYIQGLLLYGEPFPESFYDYGFQPFTLYDRSSGMFPVNSFLVKDSVVADFTGDGLFDVFFGRARHVSSIDWDQFKIRAGLVLRSGISEQGFSFNSQGDQTITVKPEFRFSPGQIYIGEGGWNPASSRFFLSAVDISAHGLSNDYALGNEGIFIGYDPGQGKWQFKARSTSFRELYFEIDSSMPLSNLETEGFTSSDGAVTDYMMAQNPGGTFSRLEDVIPGLNPTACHSVAAADFDNDMDVDIYQVCTSTSQNLSNRLFENNGDGTFNEVPGAAGAAGLMSGSGDRVTLVDFDTDGFVDLLLSNGRDLHLGQLQLLRNTGNGNNWLEVDLEGTASNRDGIGARVSISASGVIQTRQADGGIRRYVQDHARLHFGLGPNSGVDWLEITWPGGFVQRFTNISGNRLIRLVEGCATVNCEADRGESSGGSGSAFTGLGLLLLVIYSLWIVRRYYVLRQRCT